MQPIAQRVLIIGGSSGIGLACAHRCLGAGLDVTIVGRTEEKLAQARHSLGAPGRLQTVVADFTSEARVIELFKQVDRVNHIVCTAADIDGAYELLPELELTAVQRAVESKVYGPLLVAKHGAPRLAEGGSITFTSGIAAHRPMARGAAVALVNAALEGLVRALAVELAPLRVNVVSPGWVDTPIWSFVAGDRKDEVLTGMADRLPVGRVGRPDEIAEAIGFVMGNRFTTGTVLHVDGGHRLI